MKNSSLFKTMVFISTIIMVVVGVNGCLGNTELHIAGKNFHSDNIIGKFCLGVITYFLIGAIYWLFGFLGEITLFPLYYWWQKICGKNKLLHRIRWVGTKISIGISLWIFIAVLFLGMYEKENFIFLGNDILAFGFGIIFAIILGIILWLIGLIGKFILSPIVFFYYKFGLIDALNLT
jgi:hypothetical protein